MTAVVWEASPGVRLAAEPVHLRLAGAGVAIAIAAPEAVGTSSLAHLDALWAGVVSVALLGWWLGPRAVRAPASSMLVMATLSVVLSSVLVSGAWLVQSAPWSDWLADLVGVAELSLLGLVFFGLPALVITLPSALAWLVCVRWLANHRGSRL